MPIFHGLLHWLQYGFHQHEFPVLFVLLLIEATGIPLPAPGDSFIMLAGGAQPPSIGYELMVTLTGLAGTLLGATVLFFIMQRGGRAFLSRYGKYIFLKPERLARMESWFRQRGRVAIIAGWFIPGLRIPTIVMSGLSGMAYLDFLPMAAIAVTLWITFYFWVGRLIAARGPSVLRGVLHIIHLYNRGLIIALLFALAFLALLLIWRIFTTNQGMRQTPPTHGKPRRAPKIRSRNIRLPRSLTEHPILMNATLKKAENHSP